MEKLFNEKLLDTFMVKVFGEVVSNLNLTGDKDLPSLSKFDKNSSLVRVVGFKAAGACVRLDKPKLLVLPGKGEPADDCGFEGDIIKMWKVQKDFSTLGLEINPVTINELVALDLKGDISLSVKLRDTSYKNGTLTGTIKVEAEVFFITLTHNIPVKVKINQGGEIQIYQQNVNGFLITATVSLKTLNKACARVTVSYGIFSANEEVCTTF